MLDVGVLVEVSPTGGVKNEGVLLVEEYSHGGGNDGGGGGIC